jgi:hygromycin-B 7''-O-kinase
MDALDPLDNLEAYRRLFTDTALWKPYAQQVCRRHNLAPCEPVRAGVPGTYPAFIVGERWMVKFFGRLFEGEQSFRVERAAAALVMGDAAIPSARMASSGALGGSGWPWPYLVFDYIPAASLGEQAGQLGPGEMGRIAAEMGEITRRLHALPLADSEVFPNDHAAHRAFLAAQRAVCASNHRAWGSLPARLVDQTEGFLPPVEELVDDTRPPHLIHADLTRDHLLGRVEDGQWKTLALIDYGDAMTGGLLYELAALHLDLFGGDRALLAAFLDAYGMSRAQRDGLPRRAMAACLLHRFNVLACLPSQRLQADSLAALAQEIWQV